MSRATAWWATSVEELAPIIDGWTRLSTTLGKPLSAPSWLLAWWAERPDPHWRLRVLVVEEDGGLAAVVPLYAEGRPECLRLLGQPVGLWGYGPLVNPASSPAVMAALAREIARARPGGMQFDALDPRDLSVVESLAEAWPWPGVRVAVSRRESTAGLRIEGSFDEWMNGRSRIWRSRFRRYQRSVADAGGGVRLASTPAELVADLDALLVLHQSRWQGHSLWLTPQMERALRAIVRDPRLAGGIRISTVHIGGRPVFATFLAALGGTIVGLFSGFDREFERFGPGILGHTADTEEAFRRGDRFFDFGWGSQQHKTQYCNQYEQVAWVELRSRAARHALTPPADEPHRCRRSSHDGRTAIMFDEGIVEPLRGLAAATGTTLHTTLLAAVELLVFRWTGGDDVVIGSSLGGLPRGDDSGSFAGCGDAVLLQTSLVGNPTVRELLARVGSSLDEASAARSRPIDEAEKGLRHEPDSEVSPPGLVILRVLDPAATERSAPGTAPAITPCPGVHPGVDLELRLWPEGDALVGEALYQAEHFAAPTIGRLLGHWESLLRGIAAAPDCRIAELPLLTPAELRQVLGEWNDTAVDYPGHEPLPRLFEAVVDRVPRAVAVIADGRQTTYRELDDRANRLAHHLIALGAGPGQFVGLALPRSVDFVVAVLAILKAGGAYIPLGREYPPERQRGIASDAGIRLVVCDAATASVWRDTGIVAMDIAADAVAIDGGPATRPTAAAGGDAPAYVMYTSGSTGKPKGVVIPHRGVSRLVLGTDFLLWGPDLRFLLLAPTAFDASTLELWGPLLHGATLVVHTAEDLDPRDLGRLLERERITCLWLTAALFNRIIDDCPSILSPVRHLMTGGEPLSPRHVRAALELLPGTRIINGYGPTETTTFATTYEIPRSPPPSADEPIPIGRPIGNTRCIVLDGNRQPVPVGVVGELWIGGDGVGLGYLGDTERTAEKFVALPFGPRPGDRSYRTGDRVRWSTDGTLDFLGRTDEQVKIRGFRIEPGEVEAAVARHPAVQDVVVVAREDVPGEKRLVAYLVAKPSQPAPTHAEVCDFLRPTLPSAMIPAASVWLPSLPLTANGKVDRRALPRPEPSVSGADGDDGDAVPHTELEAKLLRVWEGLFGRSPIGLSDNFFDIGGHSLLAVRLATELERLLERRVPVAAVFEAPTIASLARWAATTPARASTARPSAIVPLAAGGSGPPFFLAHGMHGDIFHFVEFARSLEPHASVHGINARDRDVPYPSTLEELCGEYVAEIRAIAAAGPYVIGGYSLGGWVAFEIARQLAARGERVKLLLFDVFPNCRVSGKAAVARWICELLPDDRHEAVSIVRRARLHIRRLSGMQPRELPAAAARLARPLATRMARLTGWGGSGTAAVAPRKSAARASAAPPDPLLPLVARYEPNPCDVDAVLFRSGSPRALPIPLFWRLLLGRRLKVHHLPPDHLQLFHPAEVPALAALVRESLPDSGPGRPRG